MRQPTPPDSRKVAPIIWAALLFAQVAFLVVASFVRPGMRPVDPGLTRLLLVVQASLAVIAVALSRLLPARIRRLPGVLDDPLALSRNIKACALCEGAGLFSIVVFLLTGSPVALAVLLLPLGGLVACYPSEARWAALGGRPRDGVRSTLPG